MDFAINAIANRLPHPLASSTRARPDSLLVVIDAAGDIVYCNAVARSWLGDPGDQLIGRRIDGVQHPLLSIFRTAAWRERVQARSRGVREQIEMNDSGSVQRFDVSLNLLDGDRDSTQGYLLQARRIEHTQTHLLELRLQRLQELARIGSWELNLKTHQAFWSAETRRILGVADDAQACPDTLLNVVHPDDRERVASAMREVVEKRCSYDIEYRVMHADRQVRFVHSRADVVEDEIEHTVKLIGFVQDITERKQVEDKIRLSASVFDSSLNAILIMDTGGIIQQVNRAFTQATGYSAQEVAGRSAGLLYSEHYAAFYDHVWQVLQAEGCWEGEIWHRRKNGETFPIWQSVSAVRDAKGETTHYIATFNDITEQKLTADYIYQLAHYDLLTSLPNRFLFSERCKHAIERARRNGQMIALLYLDLDRFKQINDSLGHPVGDELLENVALRLKEQVREEDTVARLGGDEFVIVLEQVNAERDPERVAGKILDALHHPFRLKTHELVVSASIGISLSPMDGEDVATLIKHADLAMYRAKEKGRDNFQFFSLEFSKDSLAYHLLESDLRHARARNELLLYYQPQYSLKTNRLVGAEAVIRWRHREKGLLAPDKFVPIAEESGLILNIGEWVLMNACKQAKQWRDAGLGLERISVNLSGQQIQRGNVVETVRRALEVSGLPPECLELEILETYIMRQVIQDIRVLESLRDLGIHLAIDDFGTGQSCLSYLKRLPVEKLKIDRSFVSGTPDDADDVAIARAIVALGKSMQLTVIAEGVENASQVAFLKELNCDQVQGFYYSAPIDAERFVRLLGRDRDPPTP